ncbi:MAG: metallophosphoesterase, partial [Ardenticatenales bacterium]|nr:metallophosphoesterase [Ardenticatenales bacterium]
MRILIFSDLHANWEALLWMQRAEEQPDAILFLGDAVGYGP